MKIKMVIKNVKNGLLCVSVFVFIWCALAPITQSASALALDGVTVAVDEEVKAPLTMANGATAAKSPEQQTSLFDPGGLFQQISNVALFILGAVSVLMLIYGGIRYTISGGDTGAVTSAKNTILYAIVGIVVALMAYAIVSFVIGSLAAPIEEPAAVQLLNHRYQV